jgi:hypothetical protein
VMCPLYVSINEIKCYLLDYSPLKGNVNEGSTYIRFEICVKGSIAWTTLDLHTDLFEERTVAINLTY